MEKEHQDNVREYVVSQEDCRPTESNINQHTFTTTCPPPPDIPTCCDLKFLANIKCEQILPENMHEDSAGSAGSQRGVDDHVVTGLESVKSEGQRPESIEQQTILPIMDTHLVSIESFNVKEVNGMKPEKNADPDEYSRTSSETIHWVVSPGGELKEVNPDHSQGVPEILPVEDFAENVDNIQYWSGTNDAITECESRLSGRETKDTGVEHFNGDTCRSFIHTNVVKGRDMPQTMVKQLTCEACGKSFSRRKNLRVHERIHTGVKPFTCFVCGKSFSRSSHLRLHERIHSGVKPFDCDTCGRLFADPSHLRVHERIHSGVKPFTCETCGKSFKHTGALRDHERLHTGVKPFTCNTCGKSFIQSGGLKYHKRSQKHV